MAWDATSWNGHPTGGRHATPTSPNRGNHMRTTRTRPLLAAAAALTTLVAGIVTAPSAQAEGESVRVISHNLEKEGPSLTAVIDKAKLTADPEILTLQEVCASMVPRLQELGPVAYHVRRTNQGDCSDGRIGEAVVYTRAGAGAAVFNDLNFNIPNQDQNYGMACLRFNHAARVTLACSTHLASGDGADRDALRLAGTQTIRSWAAGWVDQTDLVVIGGDFNTTPSSSTMNPMYGVGNASAGHFREIHQMAVADNPRAGLHTIGKFAWSRKVDYIFASVPDTRGDGGTEKTCWDGTDGTTNCGTTSNHRMLWGQVPLR